MARTLPESPAVRYSAGVAGWSPTCSSRLARRVRPLAGRPDLVRVLRAQPRRGVREQALTVGHPRDEPTLGCLTFEPDLECRAKRCWPPTSDDTRRRPVQAPAVGTARARQEYRTSVPINPDLAGRDCRLALHSNEHGRPLPRLHPRALPAAPQLRDRRGRRRLVRGRQPAVWRPDHADARREGRDRGSRRLHRPRVRDQPGQRQPPDRRDQGQATRRRSRPSARTTCSTSWASTSARPVSSARC